MKRTARQKNPRYRPQTIHRETLDVLKKRQANRNTDVAEVDLLKNTQVNRNIIKTEYVDDGDHPTENKDLLIGTVFMNDSPEQMRWFDLQMRYIKATTPQSFDHVTYLQKGESINFNESKVIKPSGKTSKQSEAHMEGLDSLLDYFKKHQDHYTNFLFIDSDAFPIRKNWYKTLVHKISRHEIAVALRPENLEQRLHSSILFAKKSALDHLDFNVGQTQLVDLLGQLEKDLSIGSYQEDRRKNAFPLLKSNKLNIHPLLCSIYYDLFYHNGCGTGRNFNMRARPYWRHMTEMTPDVNKWIDQLMNDPNEFISKLAGWNPEEYPEV